MCSICQAAKAPRMTASSMSFAHSCRAKAAPEQELPAWSQDTTKLIGAPRAIAGGTVVEAAQVDSGVKAVMLKWEPTYVRAQERRILMLGCGPGESHLGQVDAGHLPAGAGKVGGLGTQAASDVKSTAAASQPALAEHCKQLRRRVVRDATTGRIRRRSGQPWRQSG